MSSTGSGYNRVTMDIRATGAANAAGNIDKVTRAQKQLGHEIDKTAAKSKAAARDVGHLDQSLKTMGAFRWLSYAGFATVATGIGAITREALGFEDAMAKVHAVNQKEFAGVAGQALFNKTWQETLDIAQEYRSTGAEAADALYQIAAAGVSANDSMEVLKSSLNLAQASGYGQAESAQLQLGILNSWGMEMDDSAKIADLLTQAVNVSAINMEDLGYTMKYLSGPAAIANQSLEDVLETVALLGRAGMRGQNVGTGLATGLARLADATPETEKMMQNLGKGMWYFQDTAGNLLKLPRIIEKVAELIGGMSRTDQAEVLGNLFGKDAADVWGTLLNLQLNNKKLVEQNKAEMKDYQGQAEETAKVMNSTVSASFERLWGSITAIGDTALMQETGPMQGWLDGIADRIEKFDLNVWMEEHKESIENVGRSAEAAGDLALELVDAFFKMHDALAPVLTPVLERTADALALITSNGWLLDPLLSALIGYYVTMKALAIGTAIANFVLASSLAAVARESSRIPMTIPGPIGGPAGTPGGGAGGPAAGRMATRLRKVAYQAPIIGLIAGTAYEVGEAAGLDMDKSLIENLGGPSLGEIFARGSRTPGQHRDLGPTRYGNIVTPTPISPMTGIPRIGRDDFVPPPSGRSRTSDVDTGHRPIVVHIDGREVATAVARHTGDLRARR
jgi:TP901 family phage tail tape measure protein